jgi:superfamily II RNA helicase
MHNQQEINTILTLNFHTFQKYGQKYKNKKNVFYHRFNNLKKQLIKLDYIDKNDTSLLTEKGNFSSYIYADEILFGEIFATDLYKKLNLYQILLLIACACYEGRERTEFYKRFLTDDVKTLKKILRTNQYLIKDKRFRNLTKLTALIYPIFEGKTIFDVLENISLLEGDVIRFFRQIQDRIGQIKMATKDEVLIRMLDQGQDIIAEALKDIEVL